MSFQDHEGKAFENIGAGEIAGNKLWNEMPDEDVLNEF